MDNIKDKGLRCRRMLEMIDLTLDSDTDEEEIKCVKLLPSNDVYKTDVAVEKKDVLLNNVAPKQTPNRASRIDVKPPLIRPNNSASNQTAANRNPAETAHVLQNTIANAVQTTVMNVLMGASCMQASQSGRSFVEGTLNFRENGGLNVQATIRVSRGARKRWRRKWKKRQPRAPPSIKFENFGQTKAGQVGNVGGWPICKKDLHGIKVESPSLKKVKQEVKSTPPKRKKQKLECGSVKVE